MALNLRKIAEPTIRAVSDPSAYAPRNLDEARGNLSAILARAEEATEDGAQRLREIVIATSQGPRAAANGLQGDVESVLAMIAQREKLLLEAIDEHVSLCQQAAAGITIMQRAAEQIAQSYSAAMHPKPVNPETAPAEERAVDQEAPRENASPVDHAGGEP